MKITKRILKIALGMLPALLAGAVLLLMVAGVGRGSGMLETTIDFSLLRPGYGSDLLTPMAGKTPKGEELGAQYGGLVTFTPYSVATFAIDQECYRDAHQGQDFIGDPGPGRVFLGVTTVPYGARPGGHLAGVFTQDVMLESVTLADSNNSPGVRVLVVTYDVHGTPIEGRMLTAPYGTLTFTRGGVHSVVFFDSGGDGFQIISMKVQSPV